VGTFAVPPAEGDRLAFAAAVGFVAQDAAGSLDPSMPAWRSVTEGARIQGRVRRRSARDLAAELFRRVDLSPDLLDRLPGELSGGQCQRVAIARAVALGPGLIVADEPTSALDPIVQAGVMALLDEVRAACGATLLLVSHSLALARRHAEEVSVVHRGRVVETGAADRVLRDPAHERTRALLAAEPAF
jgi:peptide/nickel transport system ATP-binding protein